MKFLEDIILQYSDNEIVIFKVSDYKNTLEFVKFISAYFDFKQENMPSYSTVLSGIDFLWNIFRI